MISFWKLANINKPLETIFSKKLQSILKINPDLIILIDNLSSKNLFLVIYIIMKVYIITNQAYFFIFQGIPHNIDYTIISILLNTNLLSNPF